MLSMRYAHCDGLTDMCRTDDYKYIITCGNEGDVRIWDGVDDADQRDICVGEKATAIAQKDANLYVGTDANTVQSYTFPDLEPNGLITRFTAPISHIQLSSDGKTLVACSWDMEIHVVNLDSMETVRLTGHKAPVLSVACHPAQDSCIVSSGCDGLLKVWSLTTKSVLNQWEVIDSCNSFNASKGLCRMSFDSTGQRLAVPKKDSVVLYDTVSWTPKMSFTNTISSEPFSIVKFSPCDSLIAAGSTSGELIIWHIMTEKVVKSSTNENKHAVTAISWDKDSKEITFCNFSGQLGNLDVPKISAPAIVPDDANVPLGVPEFDDDDDDDGISLEKLKAEASFVHSPGPSSHGDESQDAKSVYSVSHKKILSELQSPFQPSSTPVHLQERFMVWNDVGIVRQFNSEGINDIDVEFHDTTRNHGIRMNNLLNHNMAALNDKVAVFACPRTGSEEDSEPSKVVCVLLRSWDGQKEWDVSLNGEEGAEGLAVGETWIAVATSLSFVRIFSLEGSQTDIISLPGPLVSMAGHSNHLVVVFHSAIGIHGNQNMSCYDVTISLSTKKVLSTLAKPFPLSPEAVLRWVGFTDEGSIGSYDSNGVVRLLYRNTWRPISSLDEQCKSKSDHYFVVGISESAQTIRCTLCKGAFYPAVLPRPLLVELTWQIPLCELTSDKGKLEEEYLRSSISSLNVPKDPDDSNSIEKNISVTLMKLFALACRSGLEARALSLCISMESLDVVKLAGKYAAKLGKQQLADKVNEVAAQLAIQPVEKVPYVAQIEETEQEDYSQDLFSETPKENNLILQSKQRILNAPPSPKPARIIRPGNPFKKSNKVDVNDSDNQNQNDGKVKFTDWYNLNKKRLQEEFPFLKDEELVIASLKQFRAAHVTQNSVASSQSSAPKKRKAVEEDKPTPNKKSNAHSKLKNFAFTKID